MKKKGVKNATTMRLYNSVPEHLNIVWGKKYSLKDRSPTIALIIFLILMLCSLSFLSVMKKDESSVENKGESSNSIEEVNKSYGNDLYISISSDANNDVILR
tara:strand:- start:458 stop:763 length:306 start_codon:yes stop_codon:yes gene_type:complete